MYHTCPVGTFFDYVSRGCTYRGVNQDCNNPPAEQEEAWEAPSSGTGGKAGWGAAVQALQHWLTDAQRVLGSGEAAEGKAGSRRQRSKIWVSGVVQH
jgi:hypothetical protein